MTYGDAMSTQELAGTRRHRLPVRTLAAITVGHALETYDGGAYATFAVVFAKAFFPTGDDVLAQVNVAATYALAFLFRPLGGYLIGRFTDTRGRRPALILAVSLMTGGSLLIAIVPTYAQIGWLAPLVLLLARCAQSVSVGGEIASASAYLTEIAPAGRRGRYSSFFYIANGSSLLVCSLLGLLLSKTLTPAELTSFGWRIPFAIGGLLGVVGFFLRRVLTESDVFQRIPTRADRPLRTTLRAHPRSVLLAVGITMFGTLIYYTFFTALTPFAVTSRHAAPGDVFLALSVGTALFVALQYPMGALADRIGFRRQMLLWVTLNTVLVLPLATLIGPGLGGLLAVFCLGLAVFSLSTAILPALLSSLFPVRLRALGIGAWYNVTVALFGGTAPLVINALAAAGRSEYFFYYVTGMGVLSLLVMTRLRSGPPEAEDATA